jgi:hypothetical protein
MKAQSPRPRLWKTNFWKARLWKPWLWATRLWATRLWATRKTGSSAAPSSAYLQTFALPLAFAVLLQPVSFAQESTSAEMKPRPAAAETPLSQPASDQIPDSPGVVQARLARSQEPQIAAQANAPSQPTASTAPSEAPAQSPVSSDEASSPQNSQSIPPKPQTDVPDMPPAPEPRADADNNQLSGSKTAIINQPVGTAAAQPLQTTGIAASRPAGAAVAPAGQRRVRTILIRAGALVGAGVAIGTTMALSQASPSRPPGAH